MRLISVSAVRGAAMLAFALLPAAAQAVVVVSNGPGSPLPTDLTARARWGGNNFKSALYNEGVLINGTQRNSLGNAPWTLGQPHNFRLAWDVATGTLSWAIDFNRNGSFAANETSSFVKTMRAGESYNFISFTLTSAGGGNGNPSNAIDLTNLSINGVSFAGFSAANGSFTTRWFEPVANTFRNIEILGAITFRNTGGNGAFAQERPNLNISLVGPEPVPEPAAWAMLLAGFGLVGAIQRRRVRRYSA
jgi:hypothetical protein